MAVTSKKPPKEEKSAKKEEKSVKVKGTTVEDAPVDKKTKKAKDEEARRGLSIGLKSGLGVVAYWNKILGDNAKKKLTDDELLELMAEEFPKRDKFQPVQRIRSWYNHGRYKLGKGDDQKMDDDEKSIPYGPDKKPLKMTKAEKQASKKAGKTAKDIKVVDDDDDDDDDED